MAGETLGLPPYRIIWVDDTPDWVESVKDSIVEFVAESGFEAEIDLRVDGTQLVEAAQSPLLDLLIIDHNLHGDNGEALISRIRESGTLTEVIFYSQDVNTHDVIGAVSGVFHCQRKEFEDVAKRVIELTLRKLQDLTVIRGLVIALAIDLEIKLEHLMVSVFGDSGNLFRERVLDKEVFDFGKKYMFIQGVVNDRLAEANRNNSPDATKLNEIKTILSTFESDVVMQRNILAHSRRETRNGKIVLKGINKKLSKIEVDATWLKTFREGLGKHRMNLIALETLFGTAGEEQASDQGSE